jgi:hypothetical protein
MAIWENMCKGYMPNIMLGVGVALVAPVVLPMVASLFRPVAKGVVKGGITLADKMKEIAADASEQVSDLVAEARAEHYGKAV